MTSPLAATFAWSALLLAACLSALWLLSLQRRDASIVDGFWAAGFALVSLVAFWRGPGGGRAGLALACTTLWGSPATPTTSATPCSGGASPASASRPERRGRSSRLP